MEKNLTSGSVLKSILFFSLPYLLSYFLQTLYGMADLFIIGQFEGVASTTAVSIGSQVMHMITVMIVGLAMGATVTIGRAVGAENKLRAERLAGSVVLAAVLVGLVDPIVRIVSTPEQAVAGTRTYLIICFIGVPCITAYNIMASTLLHHFKFICYEKNYSFVRCRSAGDRKRPCNSQIFEFEQQTRQNNYQN